MPLPAAGFREVVRDVVKDVFVSRAERRRARGEAHAATIKQVREVNGAQVVFEREAVEKLTLADLDNIPVPEPYGRIGDRGSCAMRWWRSCGAGSTRAAERCSTTLGEGRCDPQGARCEQGQGCGDGARRHGGSRRHGAGGCLCEDEPAGEAGTLSGTDLSAQVQIGKPFLTHPIRGHSIQRRR